MLGYSDRPLRCSDEHKVAIREMTDERSDDDSGDDEQSEESNDARSSVAMLTMPRTHADEVQSIFPPGEHSSLCRNGREQAQREGSCGHGGDAAAVSSANSYSSDTSNPRSGAQELQVTSFQDFVHSGARLRGVNPGGARRLPFIKDEEHKNQCALLASVMESRLSPSQALNRIQCSRHVQRVVRSVR